MLLIVAALTGLVAESTTLNDELICDPERYVSEIVEDMRYSEHEFNEESFRSAIDWFKKAEWKNRIEGKTYDQPFELGWEFEMSYFNRLTKIEGYMLKLRTNNDDAILRNEAIDEFCTYVAKAYPLD